MGNHLLKEDYVKYSDPNIHPNRDHYNRVTIPPNSIFVMGDNRDYSNDSRFFGFVDFDLVKAKAIYIYWSWDKKNLKIRWNRTRKMVK